MYRAGDRKVLTIPVHFSKTIRKGTLRAIIREAGLTMDEFHALQRGTSPRKSRGV
jgi:hypothetical protein